MPDERTPKYWLVVDYVTKLIQTADLRAGDALPSEQDLQNRFALSRGTVRKALDELSRRALIDRRPGSGTFVAQQRMPRTLPELTGFSDHIRSLGLEPGSTELAIDSLGAHSEYADEFAMGTSLTKLTRLRTADGQPVGIHYLVVPDTLLERANIVGADQPGTLYEKFERVGISVDIAQEHLMARRPTRAEARLLGIGTGDAVLDVRRKTFDAEGEVVELVHAVYRGDRYDYIIWLERRRG